MRQVTGRTDIRIIERDIKRYDAWRIGTAAFVAIGIGGIDQRLIGELELRCPVDDCPTSKLAPFLQNITSLDQTFSDDGGPTRKNLKILGIVGVTQTAYQFYVGRHLIVDLAKQ